MSRYIGDVSAYALAVSQGYTGTEEEYAELMASYATVGQTAVTAAQTATTKASEAATSATTATNKASEAMTAAQTATSKAGEATTAAATATSAATTATTAKDDAVSAKTAAQTAKTAAETAQTAAELAQGKAEDAQEAAETAQAAAEEAARTLTIDTTLTQTGQAADAKKVGDEFSSLKEDLSDVSDSLFTDVIRSEYDYTTGNNLNNAYVWVCTSIVIPKGCVGELTHINQTPNIGKSLHIVLLKKNETAYTVIKDITSVCKSNNTTIYINDAISESADIYIGFYSNDAGIVYKTSGSNVLPMQRCAYSDISVGSNVILDGSFNMDFAFGLRTTQNEKNDSVVVVDINGNGDYTSILSAMTNEPEGTVIFIKPGIYEQDMTACLKKRIILIGADRNQCIIRDSDGRYGHHPLYVSCGYFDNLTIEAPYISGISQEIGVSDLGAYAVHIDTDEDYAIGKTCEFHHCTIKSDFFPAVGLGMRKDATYIFDDCELVNGQIVGRGDYSDEGTLGALYFHDSNGAQGDQYIKIKDCVLKSNLAYAMCPYKVNRTPQNNRVYCDFVNNVLYSAIGKYANTVWFRDDPFNPSTGIFSIGIGYGNSIASLNNN